MYKYIYTFPANIDKSFNFTKKEEKIRNTIPTNVFIKTNINMTKHRDNVLTNLQHLMSNAFE